MKWTHPYLNGNRYRILLFLSPSATVLRREGCEWSRSALGFRIWSYAPDDEEYESRLEQGFDQAAGFGDNHLQSPQNARRYRLPGQGIDHQWQEAAARWRWPAGADERI